MKQEADLGAVKSLYVTGLPEGCTDDQVGEVFSKLPVSYERVVVCDDKVMRPHDAGARRHYAFVHYAKRSDMLRALDVRPCRRSRVYGLRASTPVILSLTMATLRSMRAVTVGHATGLSDKLVGCPSCLVDDTAQPGQALFHLLPNLMSRCRR